MNGIVFDIQNYAIYDGPGIRTLVFLKGCPMNCLWCHNPESQKLEPQISYFQEKCRLCGKCVENCPEGALKISTKVIIRDTESCKVCGVCVEACPNDVIEIIGENKDIQEIVEEVIRDKIFYENSGGGVTISGGEPTMQKIFLLGLLAKLKSKGIHTAIETCGYFKKELIEKLIEVTDLFLFDIKHIDPELHKKYTGVSNHLILNNFKEIYQSVGQNKIICRIPLIPGINTDIKTILDIIKFLKKIKYDGEVHLMPYNKLAKSKYEKIGKIHLYKDFGELTESKMKEIIEIFKENSYKAIINE